MPQENVRAPHFTLALHRMYGAPPYTLAYAAYMDMDIGKVQCTGAIHSLAPLLAAHARALLASRDWVMFVIWRFCL
jgi:hypothetical protein